MAEMNSSKLKALDENLRIMKMEPGLETLLRRDKELGQAYGHLQDVTKKRLQEIGATPNAVHK